MGLWHFVRKQVDGDSDSIVWPAVCRLLGELLSIKDLPSEARLPLGSLHYDIHSSGTDSESVIAGVAVTVHLWVWVGEYVCLSPYLRVSGKGWAIHLWWKMGVVCVGGWGGGQFVLGGGGGRLWLWGSVFQLVDDVCIVIRWSPMRGEGVGRVGAHCEHWPRLSMWVWRWRWWRREWGWPMWRLRGWLRSKPSACSRRYSCDSSAPLMWARSRSCAVNGFPLSEFVFAWKINLLRLAFGYRYIDVFLQRCACDYRYPHFWCKDLLMVMDTLILAAVTCLWLQIPWLLVGYLSSYFWLQIGETGVN